MRVKRRKISVSIDENLVEWLDDIIGRGVFKNKSHMIEVALRHLKRDGVKRALLELLEEEQGENPIFQVR